MTLIERIEKMIKLISFLTILIHTISLISLTLAADTLNSNEDNNGLKIDKANINKIIISAIPKRFETLTITSKKHIRGIIDYLHSIKPIISEDNLKYAGGGYSIKIVFKDNNERIFGHSGNKFLIEKNKFKYKMQYKDAIKINGIIASILEDKYNIEGKYSITGIVKNIKKETSGRNTSCVVLCQNNSLYDVNLNPALIIDSTGNGWLILHDNDKVRVFYDSKNEIKMGTLNATTVFIKKTAN